MGAHKGHAMPPDATGVSAASSATTIVMPPMAEQTIWEDGGFTQGDATATPRNNANHTNTKRVRRCALRRACRADMPQIMAPLHPNPCAQRAHARAISTAASNKKKPIKRGFVFGCTLAIWRTSPRSKAPTHDKSLITSGSITTHSASVNKRERVWNALPVLPSSEKVPPEPSITSRMSWVCFQ